MLIPCPDRKTQERAEKKAKAQSDQQEKTETESQSFNHLLNIFNEKQDNDLSSDDGEDSSHSEEEIEDEAEESEDVDSETEHDDGQDVGDGSTHYFRKHFGVDYDESTFEKAVQDKSPATSDEYSTLGRYQVLRRSSCLSPFDAGSNSIKKMGLKKVLETHASLTLSGLKEEDGRNKRLEFLSIISQYIDVMHMRRKLDDVQHFRWCYCLHILNHMLNVRQQVLKNNTKIQKAKMEKKIIDDMETRDQGFTRARVLILLPFRESAKSVVQMFASLLFGPEHQGPTIQMKRFLTEFSSSKELRDPQNKKPVDYMQTFAGNTDDSFRIGMAITKKSLKLYTDFYDSDVIICSPLSLRMMITSERPDYDFLSSIEILVLDQTEIFLMQNWEHVIEIVKHVNLKPANSERVDFSRVKMPFLDEKASLFRQNIVLGSAVFNEAVALFNRSSSNYAGQVVFPNDVPLTEASISRVFVKHPQQFIRHECTSLESCSDARFEYFTHVVMPSIRDETHVLIYVSSYFDFVRLRNFLKREEYNFVSVCEYTDDGKVAQCRSQFVKEGRRLMLYTERIHFYRRFLIKGVRKVIFYQLPSLPQFYSQICNLTIPALQGSRFTDEHVKHMSICSHFCRYDVHRLRGVLGTERASKLLLKSAEDKTVFHSE